MKNREGKKPPPPPPPAEDRVNDDLAGISKMPSKFFQNDRNGRKWSMLLKVQRTSTVFAKIGMK